MTPAQHLTWDSRPGADGSTVHLPKYSEVEAAEPEQKSFTPGPWTYDYAPEPGHASEFMVLGPRNAELAYVGADEARGVVGAMVEFNARLIAAAPALAAELQRLYEVIAGNENGEYMDGSDCLIRIADVLTVAGLQVHP